MKQLIVCVGFWASDAKRLTGPSYNPATFQTWLWRPAFVSAHMRSSLLGAGGMGEVYKARDTRLNRDTAIKVLPDQLALDPDRLARLKREAQVLASFNHRNIAAIYGFEEADGVQALVLELVEGPTLADVPAQRASLTSSALAGVGNREYDIGRNGKVVGLIETGINANTPASASQMQIVLNWFEELKQRTAVK